MLFTIASMVLSTSFIQDIYVQGYKNTNNLILVSKIPGIDNQSSSLFIKQEASEDLLNMLENAAKAGIYLKINYAFRDYKSQAIVKKRNPRLAAKPGKSSHQEAISIDISGTIKNKKKTAIYLWLKENAYKYNFYQPMAKEPWHWTWNEKRN